MTNTLPAKASENVPAVRGMYHSTIDLQQAFEAAARQANLLAPVTRIDYIPEFHSVSLRILQLDTRDGGGDLYQEDDSKGKGEWSLTGRALDKLAAAAGVSWDAVLSGRLDDASEPFYCRYRAVGWVVDFDNSRRQIGGEKEVDFRNGSPQIAGWQDRRVRRAREHIVALAESKAKNRAIRHALAIKSKYTVDELSRPFVVPKLVFTGETEDPELRRLIAQKITDRALGVSGQLYPSGSLPALGAVPQDHEIGRLAPPPIKERQAITDAGGAEEGDCPCPDGPAGLHLEGCKKAKGRTSAPEQPKTGQLGF